MLLLMPLLTQSSSFLASGFLVAGVDTISSLANSEGGVIPVCNLHELLIKVHNILDNAVSKQVWNSAHILAHLFNSASRQCCEVWASQFPFLHGLKDVVPLVRLACMAV